MLGFKRQTHSLLTFPRKLQRTSSSRNWLPAGFSSFGEIHRDCIHISLYLDKYISKRASSEIAFWGKSCLAPFSMVSLERLLKDQSIKLTRQCCRKSIITEPGERKTEGTSTIFGKKKKMILEEADQLSPFVSKAGRKKKKKKSFRFKKVQYKEVHGYGEQKFSFGVLWLGWRE